MQQARQAHTTIFGGFIFILWTFIWIGAARQWFSVRDPVDLQLDSDAVIDASKALKLKEIYSGGFGRKHAGSLVEYAVNRGCRDGQLGVSYVAFRYGFIRWSSKNRNASLILCCCWKVKTCSEFWYNRLIILNSVLGNSLTRSSAFGFLSRTSDNVKQFKMS